MKCENCDGSMQPDLLPNLSSFIRRILFRLCPGSGRAANSVGVSPLRLVCGRLVLYGARQSR